MINIKSLSEIKIMKEGGKILSNIFELLEGEVKEGVNSQYLDQFVFNVIKKSGAEPSFLGYRGYKYSTCISKNEESRCFICASERRTFCVSRSER